MVRFLSTRSAAVRLGKTSLLNWKVIRDSVRSLFSRGGASKDDDPILSPRTFAIFTGLAIVVTAVFSSVFMGLSVVVVVLSVVVVVVDGGGQS